MANRVYNKITIRWKINKQLKEDLFWNNWVFWFNHLLPLPEELKWTYELPYIVPEGVDKQEYILQKVWESSEYRKSLEHLYEYQSRLDELKEKYWYSSAYDWLVNNRWTKWGPLVDSIIEHADCDQTIITFDTPWCTPYAWFIALCTKHHSTYMCLEHNDEQGMLAWKIVSDDDSIREESNSRETIYCK